MSRHTTVVLLSALVLPFVIVGCVPLLRLSSRDAFDLRERESEYGWYRLLRDDGAGYQPATYVVDAAPVETVYYEEPGVIDASAYQLLWLKALVLQGGARQLRAEEEIAGVRARLSARRLGGVDEIVVEGGVSPSDELGIVRLFAEGDAERGGLVISTPAQ